MKRSTRVSPDIVSTSVLSCNRNKESYQHMTKLAVQASSIKVLEVS